MFVIIKTFPETSHVVKLCTVENNAVETHTVGAHTVEAHTAEGHVIRICDQKPILFREPEDYYSSIIILSKPMSDNIGKLIFRSHFGSSAFLLVPQT